MFAWSVINVSQHGYFANERMCREPLQSNFCRDKNKQINKKEKERIISSWHGNKATEDQTQEICFMQIVKE